MENGTVVQFLDKCMPDIKRVLLVSICMKSYHCMRNKWILQCLDVADGVEYLHRENIIHGDLKGVSQRPTALQTVCMTLPLYPGQHTGFAFTESLHL